MGLLDSLNELAEEITQWQSQGPWGQCQGFQDKQQTKSLNGHWAVYAPLCSGKMSGPVTARHLLLPFFMNRGVQHSYVKLLYNWMCVFNNFSPLFGGRELKSQISVSEVLDLKKVLMQ